MTLGIVSYGLYLPEGLEPADQIAARWGIDVNTLYDLGIKQRYVPSKEDQPVVMAVKAARRALASAGGLGPEEVDVVIWTGEEYKDYIAQTPSIRLQEETGCKNAWAFDLVAQGVTLIQGLRVARDLIASDENVHTVLLAGGTRNIDLVDGANPDTRFLMASSASGGAVIVRRDHPRNLVLGTAFLVHPHMADEVYVPGGGTQIPFRPENLNTPVMFYQTPHPGKVADYLEQHWAKALCDTAKQLPGGGRTDCLALRHLSTGDRQKVLEGLNLEPEQCPILEYYGHHGTNDTIISLDLGIKQKTVKDGTLVTMLTGGIGFTYAAASIRWGGP